MKGFFFLNIAAMIVVNLLTNLFISKSVLGRLTKSTSICGWWQQTHDKCASNREAFDFKDPFALNKSHSSIKIMVHFFSSFVQTV